MYKKKILVKRVFDEAKKTLPRRSKSSIAAYLSSEFEERFGYSKDERTFVRFYTALVEKNVDYDIDDVTLDWFSEYIGYDNYKAFRKINNFSKINEDSSSTSINVTFDNEAKSLTDKLHQIVINITTTPIFKLPEFLTKQSNLGIIGVLICGGFIGNHFYNNNKIEASDRTTVVDSLKKDNKVNGTQTLVYVPQTLNSTTANVKQNSEKASLQKQYMYWNGNEYIPEDCNQPKNNLIAIDLKKLVNFKKITIPDTITEKSLSKVWYSKYNNEVEFFTADGVNPENGKELRQLTKHMWSNYIDKN